MKVQVISGAHLGLVGTCLGARPGGLADVVLPDPVGDVVLPWNLLMSSGPLMLTVKNAAGNVQFVEADSCAGRSALAAVKHEIAVEARVAQAVALASTRSRRQR